MGISIQTGFKDNGSIELGLKRWNKFFKKVILILIESDHVDTGVSRYLHEVLASTQLV